LLLRSALRTAGIGLLLMAATAAPAQRASQGQGVERAVEAASRAQESAARAQDRTSAAQDRASRAEERTAATQDRSARAADAAARAGEAGAPGLGIASSASNGRGGPRLTGTERERHRQLALAHPEALELVDRAAAVRGEVVSIEPSAAVLQAVQRAGFTVTADETIEGIELRYVTLQAPAGRTLQRALADLRQLAPDTEFAANHIHLQSATTPVAGGAAALAASSAIDGPAIGLIDGGVAETGLLRSVMQQGFAAGAPAADAHATAVASLIAGTGEVKSAAPGAPLLVADVYGRDPQGGNAVALARALGWMASRGAPIVVVSLVGPANPIVARAVRQVQARGMLVVAPVGNAGAAARPMYPAAYAGVVGVTGVDSRNRALVEAGRGAHVDFAAPGADIRGAAPGGALVRVRGTSYAAPLVAGRLWLARSTGRPLATVAAEAVDLGRRGRDPVFGEGLVCGACR
jgi:minor extracellular protease Epr